MVLTANSESLYITTYLPSAESANQVCGSAEPQQKSKLEVRTMPGWYTHMEVAKQAIVRLRSGQNLPPEFTQANANDLKTLGDIAYKWRNYLALGALGPDIFFLLPDFTNPLLRNDVSTIVYWVRDQWDVLDKVFMKSWDQYARPAVNGQGSILNSISGGVINEIGQAQKELSAAMQDLVLDIAVHLWDWFGILGSGVPSGVSDKGFFWSDMFHYRHTYKFAQKLFQNAQNAKKKEQCTAFALGWMAHCATDVTGHSFVNQKVGGPWRLHWQRHHLVENHIDSKVYDTQHGGVEPYGELDTSCLHFRLAFRHRNDGVYDNNGAGCDDAPAYDYFAGFPPYDTSDSDQGDINRTSFFDLDSGDLDQELCDLIIQTMKDVYYGAEDNSSDAPQILRCSDLSDTSTNGDHSGRPSADTIQRTYGILYDFVKSTSTSGSSPGAPPPPPIFNDHQPPPFPAPPEDTTRGSEPESQNPVIEALFQVFGFLEWLADFGEWLATLPAAVAADLATWPARIALYLGGKPALYPLCRHPPAIGDVRLPAPET